MSDSEMIEYEINDDLNESLDRNLAEMQIKNNNDINLQYSKNARNAAAEAKKNLGQKEKQLFGKKPNSAIDPSLTKILQGKTVRNSALANSLTAKNADLKHKNEHNVSSFSNKKGNLNYSSSARNYKNFSTDKKNLTSKNDIKQSAIDISNINAYKNPFAGECQGNAKFLGNYNNFNTIGNYETEGFLSTKNKYASTFKLFGNTNNTNNTINNSAMRSLKKSIDIEKTKTITNNKTDYKTINSNVVNYSKNTLIHVSEKNSKFEVKLKDHLNTLKNQKAVPMNPSTYKENVVKNSINNSNASCIARENKNVRNLIPNKPNHRKNLVDSKSNNNNILTPSKNKSNSYLNLKLNLDPSCNSNVKENDCNFDYAPQTTKNDADIKFLLSEQFKSSLDNSVRKNNMSFNSNLSKMNKSATKKSLISFDLHKQRENQRSLSIGERLYRKSIAYKNLKEKRVSIELSKKNLETISNCSFKPKICEDSIMINVKSKYATISNLDDTVNHNNDSKDFDSSYFIKHKTKLIESHKLKRELEDLKELKPSIKKPEHEIRKLTEKLYNEKMTLQVEREKLADLYFSEIYPFKPNINNKEEPNVEKFYDRLQNWIEKRNENHQKDLRGTLFDYKTGQKLFHPTITETIDTSAHRQDMDLFSFLYEEQKMKQEKFQEREQIKQKYHEEACNVKHTTHKTDVINKLLKEDCYANLFNILDHNSDGVIECNEEFVKNAEEKLNDKNLFDLFKPIFSELKEHEESLLREEFYLALDELFKVLNVSERRRILNWYVELKRAETLSRKRSIRENKELTFHPQISDKSQLYYNHSTRYSKNFLDRNEEFLNTKDAYQQEKSKEKVQKELEACTFKPEINKKSEEIDKRNKLAFLLNLDSSDLNFDYLLKPQSKEKINNLSRI